MVRVEQLSHYFGDVQVLKSIDFDVEKGEILCIMGSSGGGKTTLLKCIGGLLKPTEGHVTVEDVQISDHLEREGGRIGMVFQYAALFDSLSVEENILFGLRRQKKLSPEALEETLDYLLSVVNLDPPVRKKYPSELSGGMRKRVGLARALAMKPNVLLYDEPTSGLDPVTTYSIDSLIVQTRDALGITSIVVSHDLNSVMRVADRILFLHQGEVVYWGDPQGFKDASHEAIREFVQSSTIEKISFSH